MTRAAVLLALALVLPAACLSWAGTPHSAKSAGEVVEGLIPQPRHIALTGEDFHLGPQTVIVSSPGASEGEKFAIANFNEFLEQCGLNKLTVDARGVRAGGGGPVLVGKARRDLFVRDAMRLAGFATDPRTGDEGYQLLVDASGVILHAETDAGVFYGMQTLKQLVFEKDGQPLVAGVKVTDYPRYRLRGFQFDAGRAPHSPALMERVIRIASSFKLNFVTYREGDDELNAVRYKTNKLGSLNPEALSVEEIAEVVDYASKYHVRVIPEIESLGHCGAKAFLYPDIVGQRARRQHYPGIGVHLRKRRFLLDGPRTYELLESIYSEWVPMINSPYVHIGCDEAGGGSGEHLAKLAAILDRLGRPDGKKIRPVVWADAAPTPEHLKDRFIRCLWAYGETAGRRITADNPFLRSQKVSPLLQPGCKEEVLMAGGSDSYHWPLAKCQYVNALENLYSWCRFGEDKPNFIGVLAVQWCGNQQDLWLPDYVTCAEYGWTPDKPEYDYEKLFSRITRALTRLRDYTQPAAAEIHRSCWDGIWLDGDEWQEDVMAHYYRSYPFIRSDSGTFLRKLQIQLASPLEGLDIRYRLDGQLPTVADQRYGGPFTIDGSATVTAAAFTRGCAERLAVSRRAFRKVELVPATEVGQLKPGLKYRYYEGRWNGLPDFGEITPAKEGLCEGFNIEKRRRDDAFGFVWEGFVRIPKSGVWRFCTRSDDGSSLWVGETQVVANDGRYGIHDGYGETALEAGFHPLRVHYFEGAFGELLKVYWKGPGIEKQPVPTAVLFRRP